MEKERLQYRVSFKEVITIMEPKNLVSEIRMLLPGGDCTGRGGCGLLFLRRRFCPG